MKRLINILGNILFYAILLSFIVVIANIFSSKKIGQLPSLLGYKFLNVLTGSMSPTFDEGSLIIIKETEEEEIKVGDIITYNFDGSNSITTHRVVEVMDTDEGKVFVTRGDANNVNDPSEVKYRNVEGVVKKSIPRIGEYLQFIGENLIVILGALLSTIIIVWVINKFIFVKKKTISSNKLERKLNTKL